MRVMKRLFFVAIALFAMTGAALATGTGGPAGEISSLAEVQKYFRAIHVMAMLLVGFGFLMVFVKGYGRSALVATFLLVSVAIPAYFLKDTFGFLGGSRSEVDRLILAEFAAASLLICAGAVLGRVKMHQYVLLGLLFVPCYAFNEWILLDGGFGLIEPGRFVDTGGSVVIHAFGALFGIGVAVSMTTRKEYETPIESDETSDRFSLLGSMMLWVFWPSFCAALVAPREIPATVVNVVLALCGSTLATYVASLKLTGRISVADIANAALAGGVAIGSTCDKVPASSAFAIGVLAGTLSTVGFERIQGWFGKFGKKVDTCGVLQLHGLPGLFGGAIAMFAVQGIGRGAQIKGILVTVACSILSGLVVGKILSLAGRRATPYDDAEELLVD